MFHALYILPELQLKLLIFLIFYKQNRCLPLRMHGKPRTNNPGGENVKTFNIQQIQIKKLETCSNQQFK